MSPSAIGSLTNSKATSYLLVIDLLKGYFKIQDRDDLHEIREKATGKLLTLDESLKPTLSAMTSNSFPLTRSGPVNCGVFRSTR